MISFKQFLAEAAVGKSIKYDHVDLEKAVELLNTHCKDALWMLKNDSPIWRAQYDPFGKMLGNDGVSVIDPSKTQRKSENTSNYYTLILDNHPEMVDFPKRSRSLIASATDSYPRTMIDDDDPWAVIPYDGVKIGVCPHEDIWLTPVSIFGHTSPELAYWNGIFAELFKDRSWKDFTDYAAKLKFSVGLNNGRGSAVYENFCAAFRVDPDSRVAKSAAQDFIGFIFKAYGLSKTKLKLATTATLAQIAKNRSREVWIGGPCVIMKAPVWNDIVSASKKKRK